MLLYRLPLLRWPPIKEAVVACACPSMETKAKVIRGASTYVLFCPQASAICNIRVRDIDRHSLAIATCRRQPTMTVTAIIPGYHILTKLKLMTARP